MPIMAVGRDKTCRTGSHWKLKSWNAIIKDKDHGWTPLIFVVYLGFFFVDPVLSHASTKIWLVDLIGPAIFFVLYLGLFVIENPLALAHIGGMVVLGILYQYINEGACTFFIYAASMLPFCVETQTASFVGIATVGSISALQCLLMH